jgi:hypothetical protein
MNKTTNSAIDKMDRANSQGWCTGFWQIPSEKRPFVLVKHDDRLSVADYCYGYFYFGSVAGCAAKDYDNTEREIARSKAFGHQLVWVSALCSIIDCSGRSEEEKAMDGAAAGAKMHHLKLGSLVWFEGQTYRLDRAANHNIQLAPVRVHFNGDVTEGEL